MADTLTNSAFPAAGSDARAGELAVHLPEQGDAGLYFIGRIRTPWASKDDNPPRKGDASEGPVCRLELDPRWAPGLRGIEAFEMLQVLFWMDRVRRDLVDREVVTLDGQAAIKHKLDGTNVKDLTKADVNKLMKDIIAGKTRVSVKTKKLRGRAVVRGGPGTATRTIGLLGGILTYAIDAGIIDSNPTHGLKKPKYAVRTRRLTEAEYRTLGSLPADQFIPALMAQANLPYYAGLLSAAQYHGAAHHRPQEFQVMLGKARRPIECGKVRVVFYLRKGIAAVPVQQFNTPRGTVVVSTPAATAFDLVGYEAKIGGLDAVATILVELAEKLDAEKVSALAPTVPLPWVQRLGYLLERIGEASKAGPLKEYVRQHARQAAALQPSVPAGNQPRDPGWKLIVNAHVEAET